MNTLKTKSFLYLFVAVVISMTAACVNNQQNDNADTSAAKTAQDPGEFLKDFFELWNAGNIDSSMTMIYQTVDMSEEEKAKLKQGLQTGYDQLMEENGGIAEITILHKEMSEEGSEVMVTYMVEYVNGGAKEVTRKIVKHEGEWWLSL